MTDFRPPYHTKYEWHTDPTGPSDRVLGGTEAHAIEATGSMSLNCHITAIGAPTSVEGSTEGGCS